MKGTSLRLDDGTVNAKDNEQGGMVHEKWIPS
jgi:hypothetical protein